MVLSIEGIVIVSKQQQDRNQETSHPPDVLLHTCAVCLALRDSPVIHKRLEPI